ncbi:hypothetical protein RJ639_041634, partial [Escallonia herrerae]
MAPGPASISKTLVVKIRRGGPVFIPSVPLKWVPTLPTSSSFSTSAPAISSLPESQENERGSGWSRLLLFVPGAIAFGLGTWQIFRRQDKVNLRLGINQFELLGFPLISVKIELVNVVYAVNKAGATVQIKMLEYRQNKLGMGPLNCNDITTSSKSMEPLEFRRVVLKGVFDEDKPIYVGPRSRSISGVTENGYYLITSLKLIPDNPESYQFSKYLRTSLVKIKSSKYIHRIDDISAHQIMDKCIMNDYSTSPLSNDLLKTEMCSVQIPVLVNRGWVPRSWRDKSLEVSKYDVKPVTKEPTSTQESAASSWWRFWSKKPDIKEDTILNTEPAYVLANCDLDQVPEVTPVEVVGVVRGSEKPSIFVPANDPSSNQWFYVDVAAIARACGLPEDTVYLEDINDKHNPSNQYPVPKDVNTLIRSSVLPQDHLNYTLT